MTEQEGWRNEFEDLPLHDLVQKFSQLPIGGGEPAWPGKDNPAYIEYKKLFDWMNEHYASIYKGELTIEKAEIHLNEMEDYLMSIYDGDDLWIRFRIMCLRGCIWEVESSIWKSMAAADYGDIEKQKEDLVHMKETLTKSNKYFMMAAIMGGERDLEVSLSIASEFEACGFVEEAKLIKEASVIEPGRGEYGRARPWLN